MEISCFFEQCCDKLPDMQLSSNYKLAYKKLFCFSPSTPTVELVFFAGLSVRDELLCGLNESVEGSSSTAQ